MTVMLKTMTLPKVSDVQMEGMDVIAIAHDSDSCNWDMSVFREWRAQAAVP